MKERKRREKRYYGEPIDNYGQPWTGTGSSPCFVCQGCGSHVKRVSAPSHIKSEECVARSEMKKFRDLGYAPMGNWLPNTRELFPENAWIKPEWAVHSFRRGGWGRSNRTSRCEWFPKEFVGILWATHGAESLNLYNQNDAAANRHKAWFAAIFASEETARIALFLFGAHFSNEEDGYTIANYQERACREWALKVATALDVPVLATKEERAAEDARLQEEQRERYERERAIENELLEKEAQERGARDARRMRWTEALSELVIAARNVAEPDSELAAALRQYEDFNEIEWRS